LTFRSEVAAAMPTALSDQRDVVRLVGDVGGTHARFALVTGAHGRPHSEAVLPTADYADLGAAAAAYLRQVGSPQVGAAAVAIANPIDGDTVRMTNSRWAFSIEETRRRLGLTQLLMLNDWEAMALAAPAFAPADLIKIGRGESVDSAPRALIGPGTGLGVSALVRSRHNDEWVPIAGEGGHVTVAPTDEREADILRITWRRHAHVSAERLISGMGLENLYRAIAVLDGVEPQPYSAADVSRRGLGRQDAQCAEAVAKFCALLGNVAGNLALTLGARGGVYVGGGIVRRFGDYFALSPFREKFEAKGRFADFLARIPTYVIRADNPALAGAAMALGVRPAG
jgi:glucokinase